MAEYREHPLRPKPPGKFQYVQPTPAVLAAIEKMRAKFIELDEMLSYCGENREAAIARTKLEECAMWANKALTHGN